MVCLNSKLYYCLSNEKDKFSCKGTQKTNNNYLLNYKNFKNVLVNNLNMFVENKSMRYLDGSIVWYSVSKCGLTAKYNKRHTMSDNVSTCPLEENEYI